MNHNKDTNTTLEYIPQHVVVIRASKDIKVGDELYVDYCIGEKNTKQRNKLLKKHGIEEEVGENEEVQVQEEISDDEAEIKRLEAELEENE